MLRAVMDALPIPEATGLPYASTVMAKDANGATVPVGHMCGHDTHVAWLVGAATLLSDSRANWNGTLMVVFQIEAGDLLCNFMEQPRSREPVHLCSEPETVEGVAHVGPRSSRNRL
jgi:hypothetical protein